MDLSSILSLGSVGLGLFTSFCERNLYRKRESDFEYQAALNRQLGQFNAEILQEAGDEAVKGIAAQANTVISKQKTMFAARGIKFEGSPMMVMGETATMGSKQSQKAYFNTQIQKVNYQYKSLMAQKKVEARVEEAKYGALASTIKTFKQIMNVNKMENSEEATVVAPNVNIFDFWK